MKKEKKELPKQTKSLQKFFFPKEERTVEAESMEEALEILKK